MPPHVSRNIYIQRVLDLYRLMPGTIGHVRRDDRQLAGNLHDSGISIDVVAAAMLLAAARRTHRPGAPLPPISSLHYMRPLIDELLAQPVPADQVAYLRRKVAPVSPNLVAASVHQLP